MIHRCMMIWAWNGWACLHSIYNYIHIYIYMYVCIHIVIYTLRLHKVFLFRYNMFRVCSPDLWIYAAEWNRKENQRGVFFFIIIIIMFIYRSVSKAEWWASSRCSSHSPRSPSSLAPPSLALCRALRRRLRRRRPGPGSGCSTRQSSSSPSCCTTSPRPRPPSSPPRPSAWRTSSRRSGTSWPTW